MTVGSRTPATARSARGQVKCHRSAPCGAKSPPSQHHQPGGDECDPDEWRLQPTRGLAPGWIEHRVNGAPHLYAEVARLSELAAAQLSNPRGDGLRTVELAIRAALLKLGGALPEDLLAVDTGHRGPRVACDQGHDAEFVSYRPKFLDTVLGEVKLQRAWYHCTSCRHGLAPRDRELDIAASSLSPGLRRMVARVGSQEPFAQGRRALAELAGISLTAKRVERSSEATGARAHGGRGRGPAERPGRPPLPGRPAREALCSPGRQVPGRGPTARSRRVPGAAAG